MTHFYSDSPRAAASRKAFTLVELLVVIGIIGLLAAILFPAFRRAQESGAQANCASNLKQIYQAVELYRQDEKYYPSSLAFLLPNDATITKGAGTANVDGQVCSGNNCPNPGGTGFFKGGRDALICNDDDTDSQFIRSSYGNLSTEPPAAATPELGDMSNYIWNYWGYRADNVGTCNATDASGCAGTAYSTPTQALAAATSDNSLLFNPASPPTNEQELKNNPLKYSLANRFAPTSTIITHCVYHRLPTAGGKISAPFEVTTDNGGLARDIVLRRDGSTKVLDISKFHTTGNWATQNF